MSFTTAQAFDKFYDAVKLDAATEHKVVQRRDRVVEVLQKAFPSTSTMRYIDSHIIGSMGRKTASKPFEDIDVMVHLAVDAELWRNRYVSNSSEFLSRVRTSLNSTSTVQKVGARGQAVRLFYTDGLIVDVAAVVKYNTGGYGIPGGSGQWLTTDPLQHGQYITERNIQLGNRLRRFVVIAKQWNKAHSSRLSSFHLEMLAARTFSTLGRDTRDGLRKFFNHNIHNLTVPDPAGHSVDLSSYLTPTACSAVHTSMTAARDRADLALSAEKRGDHAEAIRHWRIILGAQFPTG
ncbi:SMODS domain-containing nucleotidyltransferase [Rhodococcus opacus]|uniref:SMODS domain-containing nucleotidyltransferase n=1 Tax=Rhodococcus opacus TaxID=37919 RepID=UPI0029530D24|nr:hypothetical protein [Rhodococcus opacus]MDV7091012.1 hypothetical protein [Rhodococcus opacus]